MPDVSARSPALMMAAIISRRGLAFLVIVAAVTIASLWFYYYMRRSGQFVVYGTDLWVCLSVAPYFLMGAAFAVCGLDRHLKHLIRLSWGCLRCRCSRRPLPSRRRC